jgi:hypothetical protein
MSLFADPVNYPELYASDDDVCVPDCGHSLCEDRRGLQEDRQREAARHGAQMQEWSRQVMAALSWDDCIVVGCLLEYGHEGQHEFRAAVAS